MKRNFRLIAIALLSVFGEGAISKYLNPRVEWTESSWASVEPTKNLTWVQCYDGTIECARLQVPLNYSDPEGDSAAIALARIKANVSAESIDYLGPIFFNPGGPGDSGVNMILFSGQNLAKVVGPQFDIVSFDPRGIARSTPKISWYETPVERELWTQPVIKELNHSSDNVASYWARTKITNQLAKERAIDILPHMQTDHTARDMLRITEAYGRDKIQYWGFSYGTILGATFAAMFPDKIHRLIIDGVLDAGDYYTGDRKDTIVDTENVLRWFFKDCHSAGLDLCPFYESSPEAIGERLNKLYDSIIHAPVPVRTELSYGLVDYERMRQTIFSSLYNSFDTWAVLAAGLADLEKGNGTVFYSMLESDPFQCSCDPLDHASDVITEGVIALGCNDGAPIPPSLEETEKYYEDVLGVSEWGSMWATTRIICSSWPDIPKTFFRGPITGNTSYPIMLIGNTADPVAPLQSAKKVSMGFPGSVVLTQDSAGHCSTSAPSLCTARAIRDYFVNGTLPEPGTVCPIEGTPFTNPGLVLSPQKRELRMTPEDAELLEALRQLGRSTGKARRGVPPFPPLEVRNPELGLT